jgi:predicted membrane protein
LTGGWCVFSLSGSRSHNHQIIKCVWHGLTVPTKTRWYLRATCSRTKKSARLLSLIFALIFLFYTTQKLFWHYFVENFPRRLFLIWGLCVNIRVGVGLWRMVAYNIIKVLWAITKARFPSKSIFAADKYIAVRDPKKFQKIQLN